jgi:hypothetical protein
VPIGYRDHVATAADVPDDNIFRITQLAFF